MELIKYLPWFCLFYIQGFVLLETRGRSKNTWKKEKKEKRSEVSISLEGEFGAKTGIVIVNRNGLRGAVCGGDAFTTRDARFVCRNALNTEYGTSLLIKNPSFYGSTKPIHYIWLGCKYESKTFDSCNITTTVQDESNKCWYKDLLYAGVCCTADTEKGVYSEDRASYVTHCPYVWATAKRICSSGYHGIGYDDSHPIPTMNNSLWFWTSTKIEMLRIGSLCGNRFSALLNTTDQTNCSSIPYSLLKRRKHYYIKEGDSCVYLDDDDVLNNITEDFCRDNCTENDTCGIELFRLSINENEKLNSSKCIQVRFNEDGNRTYNVEDCEMLRQTICLKNICSSVICQNSGDCIPNEDETDFTCKCHHNYIGPLCDKDACYPNPCQGEFEVCEVNENRTSHICIPKGNMASSTEKNIMSTVAATDGTNSIMIPVLISILALVISLVVAVVIFRRRKYNNQRKGEQDRPMSMANQTYGIHSHRYQEVYDLIDESKLDPVHHTPLSRRKPVEVVELDDYSSPSDALDARDFVEYAVTYDEVHMAKQGTEKVDSKHTTEPSEQNNAAYFILEKVNNISDQDNDEKSEKQLKRTSSYEDTDNCVDLSKQKSMEQEYELTSASSNVSERLSTRCLDEKGGIKSIPESLQRKLGIRIVSGDYSEYYAYKLLRRNSGEIYPCENNNSLNNPDKCFQTLQTKSGVYSDIKQRNKSVSDNEYDKLCFVTKKESKPVYQYDHVPGHSFRGTPNPDKDCVSEVSSNRKRSKSI